MNVSPIPARGEFPYPHRTVAEVDAEARAATKAILTDIRAATTGKAAQRRAARLKAFTRSLTAS